MFLSFHPYPWHAIGNLSSSQAVQDAFSPMVGVVPCGFFDWIWQPFSKTTFSLNLCSIQSIKNASFNIDVRTNGNLSFSWRANVVCLVYFQNF